MGQPQSSASPTLLTPWGGSHSGALGTGNPGQPGFLFLQPTPLPCRFPHSKGGPLPVGAPPGCLLAVWFPKAQRLESRYLAGISLLHGPSVPLQPAARGPAAASAQPSSVPVAEVYWSLPLPGEGARKRWFLFLTRLREEGGCMETGPPQHPHQVRGWGMRGNFVGGGSLQRRTTVIIASLVESLIWARVWASGELSKFLPTGSSVPCFTSVTCSGHLARPCGPGIGTHIFQYFSRDILKQESLNKSFCPRNSVSLPAHRIPDSQWQG